jgi:hypothetical protein
LSICVISWKRAGLSYTWSGYSTYMLENGRGDSDAHSMGSVSWKVDA